MSGCKSMGYAKNFLILIERYILSTSKTKSKSVTQKLDQQDIIWDMIIKTKQKYHV